MTAHGKYRLEAETLVDYLGRLRDKHGLEKIGRGSFSIVFPHPTDPDVVVKLSVRDRAYMAWVRFAQTRPHNRWLPRILDVQPVEVSDHPGEVWAVFMPQLTPASEAGVRSAFSREIAPWADLDAFSQRTRLSFPVWRQVLSMTVDPDTKALAQFMIQHFNRLDLFDHNFMMRGSQLVFTDPISPVV